MILIVSFNARAIAHLAKSLGLEIAIVDFWGDQDLFPLADKVYTVFKPEIKSYAAFPNPRENEEKLVELALEVISNEDIEAVLIGSGLDDRPDLWQKINTAARILGNTSKCLKTVRDIIFVQKELAKNEIAFPVTLESPTITPVRDFANKMNYPFVIKPKKTLGGIGIHLIKNKKELEEFYKKNSQNLHEYYTQEFIQGKNISSTVVGDKDTFRVLSINEQLIGVLKLGTSLPFKYCGNLIPFECSPEIAQTIENVSIKISKIFKLTGVFGIDFVLQGNTPYFMEINPRFPGTIELIAKISQLNPVKLHLDAIQGLVPTKLEHFQGNAMKCVLFAKKQMLAPKFEPNPNISDVPPPNISLMPEDPICTLQLTDPNRERLLERMDALVNQMFIKFNKKNF